MGSRIDTETAAWAPYQTYRYGVRIRKGGYCLWSREDDGVPLSVKSDSDWNRTLIECLSVSCVDIEVRNGIEAPRGRGVDVHGRGDVFTVLGVQGGR